ncbi:MAG: glycosyltransferase family 39 protein [Candidatus Omnitrophica bacterium]|nr:glycosyltransferase family 39 protein [Candidatus Omnitrophota bacterium]
MRFKLKPEIFVWIVIAFLWFYFSFFHYFDDDEFQHCHNAYLIWKGLVPYRDFFEHHLPLYHIVFSPLYIFGEKPETIFIFRFLSILSSGLVFLFLYKYLKEINSGRIALFCISLLSFIPMYLIKMTEARPESIAILLFTLGLISIFSMETAIEKLFFAGFLSGLMVCFSFKYIFAWLGLCAAAFYLKGKRDGLRFLSGSIIGIFPLFLYILIKGISSEFFKTTLIMNVKWKYRFSPSGYLYEAFTTAGFIIACAIAGLLSTDKKNAIGHLFIIAGCFLGIICIPVPYRQSYLPFLVACTICATLFLRNFFNIFQTKKLTSNCLVIIKNEITQTNFSDIRKMKLIDEISPQTAFFDGRSFLFYRMHTGYYGFMHHELLEMIDLDDYSNHVIEQLKKNNFPVVIYDYRVKQMPAKIQDFIDKNYCAFEDDIYLPGVKIDRSQFIEGMATFEINVGGWYTISFTGEDLSIDDGQVLSGDIKFLDKGLHTAKTMSFIDNLTVILKKRV